jgi:hypothetical protein
MTPNEYLQKIIVSQTLAEDSDELKTLRARRDEIEAHLRKEFGNSPKIRYGGSQAKGTLIKDSYDLDIVCYFPRDDEDAGDTLEQLYTNVKNELTKHYQVEPKTSALRVKGMDAVDFHVDVVPGRFIDESNEDTFLYRAAGEKCRLKTNIKTHIAHVKGSGVTDAIKLMKLWRTRNGVQLKSLAVELLTIEVVGKSTASLDKQMRTVLEKLRDEPEKISIKDPANPKGNDLSEIWNDSIRSVVSAVARSSLSVIDSAGWEAVFGKLPEEKSAAASMEAFRAAARAVSVPAKPWSTR